jgi:diketogulonate reductase-like aldo/keto reductase
MPDRNLSIDGVRVPRFLYGTAWKEERTQGLAELAVRQGFRGLDTANQRRHYDEAAVGRAVAAAVASGLAAREDLFLQTKFTFRRGQDHRLPYDPAAPVSVQVAQSFASSLEHLGTGWIDAYLLHGPTQRAGLAAADWEAWRAMEALHASGRARLLGVCNVTLDQLESLCQGARVRLQVVQNRCYAARGWDRPVREFCAAHGLVYQGSSLLTAKREVLARPELARIARRHGRTVSQVVFRFALDVGMVPLTGTSDAGHMPVVARGVPFSAPRRDVRRGAFACAPSAGIPLPPMASCGRQES